MLMCNILNTQYNITSYQNSGTVHWSATSVLECVYVCDQNDTRSYFIMCFSSVKCLFLSWTGIISEFSIVRRAFPMFCCTVVALVNRCKSSIMWLGCVLYYPAWIMSQDPTQSAQSKRQMDRSDQRFECWCRWELCIAQHAYCYKERHAQAANTHVTLSRTSRPRGFAHKNDEIG